MVYTSVKTIANYSLSLGLAGFFPQSPHAYKTAWRNREEIVYQEEQSKIKTAE